MAEEMKEETKEQTGQPEEKKPDLKYTDEDVDGIVSKRLQRERAKLEKELREQLAEEAAGAQSEADKLAQMSATQKAEYENDKLRKKLAELEERQNLADQMAVARADLKEAGISLPDELLGMFVSSKAEDTSKAVDQLKELWPKAVNEAVESALKRKTPSAGAPSSSGESFGAKFAKQYSEKMNGGKNGTA